jgi:hypothetical protein
VVKKNGKMMLSGSFVFSGPDIIEQLARGEEVVFEDDHREIILKVNRAEKYSVDSFSPLAWAAAVDVEITNDALEQCDDIGKEIAIEIHGEGKKSVGFNINFAQAEALVQILQNFIAAGKACDELEKPREVRAA